MLAIGLKQAKKYSKKPLLIARSATNKKHDLYYVEEGILPCQNCVHDSPLELLSKKEIFQLKRKYKVSARLLSTVEKCFANSDDKIDLGAECKSLSGKIFVEELEKKILDKLKKEIRVPAANWLPFVDPSLAKRFNQHIFLTGASGVGKSTLVCDIIRENLPEATSWCFGPLISSDPAFKKLQKELTKKRVKLVDSNKINQPIDLREISGKGTSVMVLDDPDSMENENLKWISDLASRALFHGRHVGCICFVIAHDAFSRKVRAIKTTTNECVKSILFPHTARHNSIKFMKNRLNMSAEVIKQIMGFLKKDDRWMCIQNSHPCCVLTRTGCLLL